MNINYIGLYADQISNYLKRGVLGKVIDKQLIDISFKSLRDYADPPHFKVDDYPFSDRKGMLLRYDVLQRAMLDVPSNTIFVMPDPKAKQFTFEHAKELSKQSNLTFISPAYEGVDDRIFNSFAIQQYSVGDFILSNGDTPILLMIEAIARYVSGVLGRQDCIEDDSILSGLIEAPQFCAPRSIDQMGVPEVLLSGHHQEIDRWKLKQSLRRTLYFRPDLMNQFSFSETLVKIIDQLILEDTQ